MRGGKITLTNLIGSSPRLLGACRGAWRRDTESITLTTRGLVNRSHLPYDIKAGKSVMRLLPHLPIYKFRTWMRIPSSYRSFFRWCAKWIVLFWKWNEIISDTTRSFSLATSFLFAASWFAGDKHGGFWNPFWHYVLSIKRSSGQL